MLVRSPWLVAIALTSLVPLASGCGDDDGDGTTTTSGTGGQGGGGGAGATGGQGGAAGGQGGAGGTGGVGTQSIEIDFVAQVGTAAFDCANTYPGLGTQATEVEFRDFRLYVHDVRLVEAGTGAEVPVELIDDGAWQHVPDAAPAEGTVLLDFENNSGSCQNGTAEMNGAVVGTVPEGSYDGVRFRVGVPAALNHADVALADSPLNLTAMFWSWNGGYKFIRIDTALVGQPDPFNMHLGSTACVGDATLGESVTCDNPNRPEITLDDFDPARDRIVIDYAEIVAATDLTDNQVGAPGCMSGPTDTDCLAPFAAIGLDHESGQPLPTQTAFRVD